MPKDPPNDHAPFRCADSFGPLTAFFNALAFAGVLATAVLQSKELQENRKELQKQARAQKAWADAAAKQIELTKQLESVRIRPYLKLRFAVDHSTNTAILNVINVGLGVAIIRKIEVLSPNDGVTFFLEQSKESTYSYWASVMAKINQTFHDAMDVHPHVINNTNRALSPGESQPLYDFTSIRGVPFLLDVLNRNVEVVVHFESVDDQSYTTENQYVRKADVQGSAG